MNTNEETQQQNQTSCCEECPICYDCMTDINITTTQCGHKFHSSCIFNNLKYGIDCPLCRTELVKGIEEDEGDDEEDNDEDEESYYSSDNDDNDDDEESNEDNDDEENRKPKFDFTMEQVAQKMQKMNISYADFIGYILLYSNKQMKEEDKKKYNRKHSKKIEELLDDIVDYKISVDYRDARTYAEVLSSNE